MPKHILFVINTLSRAGAETALLELLPHFIGPDYEVDLFVLLGQGELVDRIPKNVRLLNQKFSKESVLSKQGRMHLMGTACKALMARGTILRRFPYLVKNGLRMMKKGQLQADKLLWRVLADGAPRFETEYDAAIAFIEGGSAYYVADYVKARTKLGFITLIIRWQAMIAFWIKTAT